MERFSVTYNVEEKHVFEFLNHLNDIEIRKDIRAREAMEKKRLEEELTYEWSTLIEKNKVQKLKVKQLDLYLKEHVLTTVGRKLDKIKVIRCHYYRQKSPGKGNAELSSSEETGESELSQMMTRIATMMLSSLISMNTRMPVLT